MHFSAKLNAISPQEQAILDVLIKKPTMFRVAPIGAYKNRSIYLTLSFAKVGPNYHVVFRFETVIE